MNLAWVTDVHLNFLDASGIAKFCERVAATSAEGVIVSGDISEAHELANHLELLAAHLARPVYFVIGNHDAYRGSIAGTKATATRVAASSRWLRYLPVSGVIPIDRDTGLLGVDGWADTRLGDFAGSRVMLNDYLLIDELRGHTQAQLATVLQAISDAETALARPLVRNALDRFGRVVFVTPEALATQEIGAARLNRCARRPPRRRSTSTPRAPTRARRRACRCETLRSRMARWWS